MSDDLLPYLEKLLKDIKKDVVRFNKKSEDALLLKPMDAWSATDRAYFRKTTSGYRQAKSEEWMHKSINAEWAARDLENLIFICKVRRG